jgi:hypothetical protein
MKINEIVNAGRPLIDIVKLCYAADKPLLVIGRHGVGKSEVMEASANEMNIDYICRDLSLMEPPDLVGMPRKWSHKVLAPTFCPRWERFVGLRGTQSLRALHVRTVPATAPARCLNDYKLPMDGYP